MQKRVSACLAFCLFGSSSPFSGFVSAAPWNADRALGHWCYRTSNTAGFGGIPGSFSDLSCTGEFDHIHGGETAAITFSNGIGTRGHLVA